MWAGNVEFDQALCELYQKIKLNTLDNQLKSLKRIKVLQQIAEEFLHSTESNEVILVNVDRTT